MSSLNSEWYFYIVRCKDNSFYSGMTNDLTKRIEEHNNGTGAKYTHSRKPVALVYSEKCSSASEARKREAQVKKWPRAKKEELITAGPRASLDPA